THVIRGFLQHSGQNASMTLIAGSGAPNDTDQVLFNGVLLPNGTNRFNRVSGGASDRAWSAATFDVGTRMSGATFADDPTTPTVDEREFGERVTASVTHTS